MSENKKMDSVLRMVKKSLALASNNPNANEAQSAMLKAQEMMAKYNLSMSDFSMEGEVVKKEVTKGQAMDYTRLQWWHRTLARIIADNFRCNHYLNSGYGKKTIMFFGLKEDVELAKEVFSFALNEIKYLSANFIKKNDTYGRGHANALKNDYISGFLQGLQDKFKEQVDKNGWGLVLVKDALVVQEYKEFSKGFTTARSSKVTTSGNANARAQGYRDGKRFDSNRKSLKEA